jgi:elongation factor P
MLLSTDLRNGVVFKYEGKTWIVLKYEFVKMGRGSGTVKIKAKDLISGSIVERGFSQNTKFEEASVEKRSAQYLYHDEDFAYFMDNTTFEQYQLEWENVKESLQFIVESGKVILVYLEDKPIGVEIPKSVNLKVEYTEPAVKGDTSNNPMKKARLESGVEINVPLFVNIGDTVKVNTEDGTYSERVNK